MAKEHSKLVKSHFENEYKEYDKLIRRLIPKYTEMHRLVVEQINFQKDKKISILDLGIGTGQTALHLLKKIKNATIDGVDISPKMMEQAKIRLKKYLKKITFSELDIKDLKIKNKYDACIAVLSIHHLNEKQKPILFKKIYKNIKEGGIFVIGDIIKFNSEKVTQNKELEWKKFLNKNFKAEEAEYWFANYKEEDLPSSTSNQIKWLRMAGFKKVSCIWEHMNYAVFFGKK